ncbi:MAG: AAA family ATPase [Desulfuromonadales bacterium C00003094]|jgi:DNA replication protein DnaC|nr:MAG: AAA family ATPase [Desulfuromonadales bacterium C00003094]OEU76396.1 MAG: AAA family ATPase [Desulfuromonadales bacterium C00003107]
MLIHPTIEKLQTLKLTGMVKALSEQQQMPQIDSLGFEERLGLLVDREATERENRRLATRLKKAKLRQSASIEDLDFRRSRGLDKAMILTLAACAWISKGINILISGPTGVGKSYLACALAHKACLEGHSALYLRLPRLFEELRLAKADGRYGKLMLGYAKTDLLVLDDWGLTPMTDPQRRDLLELMEDRYGLKSTIITSQLPVTAWHEAIGDPTLADAILDRIVHNAHKIEMKGESMRKKPLAIDQN